jgi:hypothetical protein
VCTRAFFYFLLLLLLLLCCADAPNEERKIWGMKYGSSQKLKKNTKKVHHIELGLE